MSRHGPRAMLIAAQGAYDALRKRNIRARCEQCGREYLCNLGDAVAAHRLNCYQCEPRCEGEAGPTDDLPI